MGFRPKCAIGGLTMEKPPYIFQAITHLSVKDVEKVDPRIDCITKLTLEIGSDIPHGRYTLVLIKPFSPVGRAGKKLRILKSLRAEDVESICAFPKPDNGKWERLEIRGEIPDMSIIIRCEQIKGVPGWAEKESQYLG